MNLLILPFIEASIHIAVLFLWKVNEMLRVHIRQQLIDKNIELIFLEDVSEKELVEHAVHVDIMVGWRPTIELLNAATKLKLFINPGAGVQHLTGLFLEIQKERKVILVNGHGNATFTAEHIVAMLLGAANQLFPHHNWMKEGKWRTGDKEVKSIPLSSRKIGLLGYGHVNREVHRLLEPFGAEISVLRQHTDNQVNETKLSPVRMYDPGDLDDFLKASNVMIITLPLTDATEGLIGSGELELLGSNGFLINAGRGPVVEEAALYNALKHQKIAAAAIDVWYNYYPEPDAEGRNYPYHYPFHELDNILLSPHRAASPMDDLGRWDDVIENIHRCANGRTDYLNVVDVAEGY